MIQPSVIVAETQSKPTLSVRYYIIIEKIKFCL